MQHLKNQLGRTLGVKDVAEYTGLDPKTVRKYYKQFGGIRVGSRFLFFEHEFVKAVRENAHGQAIDEQEQVESDEVSADYSTAGNSGREKPQKVRKQVIEQDRHGIFS